MNYRPIRSRWIVLGFFVTVVLAALCEAASSANLTFPRVLWLAPFSLLDAIAISLAAVLLNRLRRRNRDDV